MSSMYGATAAATAIRALGGGSSSSPAGLLLASLISVSALFLVVQLLVPRRGRGDLDKIPGPWRHALPLVGNIPELLSPDFHRKTLEWADKYGGIIRVKFLWRDALMVTDPSALAAICGRGEGALDKASVIYRPVNDMCSPLGHANLLTAPADEKWKAVRKAVAVSFSFQNIKRKWPLVLSKCDELVGRVSALGPGAVVDVDQAALRVTLDVIGMAGFGHDYGSVAQDVPPADHLIRVLPRCFTEVMLRVANPFRGLTPAAYKNGVKGKESFRAFQSAMRQLLVELKARGPPADDDADIASQLYRVLGEKGIEDERVLSEIGILFVEGFETTGHTTSWTLFNIATVPGVQEKVAAELDAAGLLAKPGQPPPRQLELEDLKALPFLTACAKEAMRQYPVVAVMGRWVEKPTYVGPYLIPPGTPVGTPLFAIHNTVHNYDDPEEFRPERWLSVPTEAYVVDTRGQKQQQQQRQKAAAAAAPAGVGGDGSTGIRDGDGGVTSAAAANGGGGGGGGNGNDSSSSGGKGITFMPFSEGPRNCVGQSLAKMEVMALLVKLLANFRMELAPEMGGREGVRARESTHLTLQTRGTKGIRMRMYPRGGTATVCGQQGGGGLTCERLKSQ